MEMKSDNGSVRVAFNPVPAPLVTQAAKAFATLLVSALAKTYAVDQIGLLMSGGYPINRGGHDTHVDQPEPFDVDYSGGERNGSSGDAPTEKLPSKDDETKKEEQGEPDANGEGEDSEDQADDADQGDAPDDGDDDAEDDDDGDDDAEDGGEDDEDNEDDEEDDNGPNAEDVEGGQEEEESGAEEEDEEEEELQPPKKRKK